MKKTLLAIALIAAIAPSVRAQTTITAIFGSGNPDTGWTSDDGGNIQLALRAKSRIDGSTPNDGAGTYYFATAPATRGLWNYEFSINSDAPNNIDALTTYDFYLSADGDPSQCIYYTTVNPLTHWNDNSYGNNTTANSQGVEGSAAALAPVNNIAQNSQNITFGDYPGGAQTLQANATYSYELYAVAAGAGPNGTKLASVSITVVVGEGGAVCVPTTEDDCKNGGWKTHFRPDGTPFKNQGDCIQYHNTGK